MRKMVAHREPDGAPALRNDAAAAPVNAQLAHVDPDEQKASRHWFVPMPRR
jgi:hypothetical protein